MKTCLLLCMHEHTLCCLAHVQSTDICVLGTHSSIVLCICMQIKPINRHCATYVGWENIVGGVNVHTLVGLHLSKLALGPTKLPKS